MHRRIKKTTHYTRHFPLGVFRRFRVQILTSCILGFPLIFTQHAAQCDGTDPVLPDNKNTCLIRQISFQGNTNFDRKELSRIFGVRAGKPYQREQVMSGLTRIMDEYRKAGFVFASINPEVVPVSADQVHVQIRIDEGNQIRTGQITISGNRLFPTSDLKRELSLQQKTPFSHIALERGIDQILALYSKHGHPKAQIELSEFQLFPDHGKVDFHLCVHERDKVRIGEIKLTGLNKTKSSVVLRELPIQVGDIFDQRKIDQSLRRLRNLGYFYEVNPSVLEEGLTQDTITFHAHMTEARTGRFSGIIGYAPPSSEIDDAPRLTGTIEASENNLLGTGRRVNLYWKSGLLKTLRFGYREPWVFGKPASIGVEYAQLKQRNQFTDAESEEQSGSLKISTQIRETFEGALAISYKRIDYAASGPSLLVPTGPVDLLRSTDRSFSQFPRNGSLDIQAQNGTKYGITFSLMRDSRNYFLNPTRGRRDSVAFEFSRGDFRLQKLWADFQQYLPTWRKQVIAIGLHAATTWGANIPPTELFYLGGANTLRGYDEDWFSGPRRVYSNFEYRLIVGRASRIFVFVDMGSVTQINQPSVFDPLRVGYGLGMRLESRGGLLRIDYGLAEGSSALQGKIHVNLGTSF